MSMSAVTISGESGPMVHNIQQHYYIGTCSTWPKHSRCNKIVGSKEMASVMLINFNDNILIGCFGIFTLLFVRVKS